GLSQPSARDRSFKWSCPSVPGIGRGLRNQVAQSHPEVAESCEDFSRNVEVCFMGPLQRDHVKKINFCCGSISAAESKLTDPSRRVGLPSGSGPYSRSSVGGQLSARNRHHAIARGYKCAPA